MARLGFRSALLAPLLSSILGVAAAAGEPLWNGPDDVPRSGTEDARFRPFDELLATFLVEQNLPGASVAVGRDGKVVYSRGFGYADVAEERTVRPTDLFRIASVSKPITAAAVLRLVERGELRLDDRAFANLDLGEPTDPRLATVTVRQLLHHTGGFDREASFDPMFRSVAIARELGRPAPASAVDVIEYMRTRPLDFDPGTKYAYSNFGYCLLGRLVERASGRSYEQYVQREILRPLGVRDMHVGRTLPSGRRRNEVRYHTANERMGPSVFATGIGQPVPAPYGTWHLEAMDAHGGWLASAEALVRFGMAFDDPDTCTILNTESIDTLFARPPGAIWRSDDGEPSSFYYACGWMVRPVGERRNTWHSGGLPGTSTLLVRRHDGLTWAVLFNTRDTIDGRAPSDLIDPLLHRAANAVREW